MILETGSPDRQVSRFPARLPLVAPAALLLAAVVLAAPAPDARLETVAEPFCQLYLDPGDKFTRVMPPVPKGRALRSSAVLSTINVNYTGFTAQAQAAFQAAVDIWTTQISSSVPIVVNANFADLGSTGLLGSAGFGGLTHASSLPGAPLPNVYYPGPIANKLSNLDRNGSSVEIGANFNSTANWSYATDGVPVSGKVDFISVVLHELGHGLGFVGTGSILGGTPTIGSGGIPYVYDAFVVDSAGTSILSASYPNGSAALGALITGTGLSGAGIFWNGTAGVTANAGTRPRLYSPSTFQSGSTFSHLDDATFPAGDINSLMTHAIGTAEVIHTPGPIVNGMFADMGWGSQCSFGLSQSIATVAAAGGAVNVTLSTSAGCAWTASESSPFVTITSGASGSGSAVVRMTVTANTGAASRAATVSVADQTLTIAQAGTTPCAYALNPASANVAAAGASGSVALTTDAGCAWTTLSSSPGVATVTPAGGVGAATIGYTVTANTGATQRAATLTIGGQSFAITQDACTYIVVPASASVAGNATSLNVAVTTVGNCAWTSSTTASFVTVAQGAASVGSGAAQFSFAANLTGASRTAGITVAGQAFTITQAVGQPVMSVDRTALRFGAVNSGVAFTSRTGTQTVRLSQSGTGIVTWTAVSSVPWLTVLPASGTGPATLTLSVVFAAGLAPTETGSITLTFTGAGNSIAPIAVSLASLTDPQAIAPLGAFDTPVDGSTGVTGSIAVTGWAVDDVDVARVRIMRDPVAGEAPGVLVFVGDAVFVEGARPDVQALVPNHPRNYRAVWGYLLLTSVLPGLGDGTFRLTAIADDVDGHSTILGSKTIACANSAATTPFGAIDTPSQGATVAGVINNFGWVLSRGTRRADAPGGGTVSVVIDGVVVGSPVSWTNRADLTALFPAAQFPGVVSPLAVHTYDTTALANGVHTISWLVTDNQGGAAGVGSRYFTVANGAGLMEESIRLTAFAQATAVKKAEATEASRSITGRRGFDLTTPFQTYRAGSDGVITIQSEELDRVELQLGLPPVALAGVGAGATGYTRVAGERRPLPIGSHLDPTTGTFTWMPGVGFVGAYDFVLAGRDVRIVLNPKGSGRVGPQTVIDLADGGLVAGWAADLDSQVDTGVDTLHVWAYPSDGSDPTFIGAAEYGGSRPDVAAIHGERFLNSGYGLRVGGLTPGTYDLAVFAYSTVRDGFVPAKLVRVTVR